MEVEFKDILKNLRLERKMSQTDLAKLLYTTQDTISLWELGKSKPNIDSLKIIAVIFDVTTDELLDMDNFRFYYRDKYK